MPGFSSDTPRLMSASALRVGFCLPEPACDPRARFSNQCTYPWRTVPRAFYFLCCNIPEYGMSTCTGTNITRFRAPSDSRSNSVLMMVVLDTTLNDNDSVRALSYITEKNGENVLRTCRRCLCSSMSVHEVNISKILAVTTLSLDGMHMNYILPSVVHTGPSRLLSVSQRSCEKHSTHRLKIESDTMPYLFSIISLQTGQPWTRGVVHWTRQDTLHK